MENTPPVPSTIGDTPKLELALLRRSLPGLASDTEHCGGCHRGMLIGERVYEYPDGEVRCSLCRARERSVASGAHVVHGPAFGHSIRVVDRRAVVHAA